MILQQRIIACAQAVLEMERSLEAEAFRAAHWGDTMLLGRSEAA